MLQRKLHLQKLTEEKDLLRDHIKRGTEALDQARSVLAESRARLEAWPTYEQRCGVNCLPQLTETVLVNRRIQLFLTGWLKRHQRQLNAVEQAIRIFTHENLVSEQQEVPVPVRHQADCGLAQAA